VALGDEDVAGGAVGHLHSGRALDDDLHAASVALPNPPDPGGGEVGGDKGGYEGAGPAEKLHHLEMCCSCWPRKWSCSF
jgi:hypothetical protein